MWLMGWSLWAYVFWLVCLFCPYSLLSLDKIPKQEYNKVDKYYRDSDTLHVQISRGFIGMKELKNNRGYWIDKFNIHSKVPLSSPYCASSFCYILDSSKYKIPFKRNALAMSFKNSESISAIDVFYKKYKVKKGMFAVFQRGNTRFGHLAVASENWINYKGKTIEFNTSSAVIGSQSDGDGCYYRIRKIEPFNLFRIKYFTFVRKNK